MVGPHNVELHLVAVARLQEAVIEATLQKRAPVEPIPVEDKDIDAVVGRRVDPPLHNTRVIVMLIAPERLLGLVVAVETGRAPLDDLPLAVTLAPEHTPPYGIIVTRGPDIGRNMVLG